MRILFCSHIKINLEEEVAGGGNWIVNHINALRDYYDSGAIQIALVCLDDDVKVVESGYKDRLFYGFVPRYMDSKYRQLLYRLGLLDVYKELVENTKEVINEFKPDIVQIFGYESPFIRLVGNLNVPIVIHFQGFKHAIYSKSSELVVSGRIGKYEPLYVKLLSLLGSSISISKKESAMNSIDYAKVEYVFGRTYWDRAIVRLVSENAKYFHIEEVLREQFSTVTWALTKGKSREVNLLTIAKNSINKNIHIIYKVVQLLTIYRKDLKVRWRIVGLNDSDSIPRMMVKMGYRKEGIEFVGKLTSNEIVRLMLDSDIYILPSAIENSPNSLQEAMMIGMPVLATHAGGVSSLIEDGVDGFLVNEGDAYSMAGKICELCDDNAKLVEVGAKARSKALERNNRQKVASESYKAYLSIIDDEKNKK